MEQRILAPGTGLARPVHFARQAARSVVDRGFIPVRALARLRKGRLGRPLVFLTFLGPGLIAANAGNDAGGIVTYAAAGAQYGYGLLWALVIITVCMAVVKEMCARMGVVTGQGLSDLIRERFGVRGAAFAQLTLLFANTVLTVSEFAGVAAASELFGIPKYLTVPIAALAVWFLVTRGSYGRVEKVFLFMTFAFFAYPIAAFLAHPNWGQVLHNTLIPTIPKTSIGPWILLLVATIGTTITPYMQLYIQSAVAEKAIDVEDYPAERAETYFAAIFGDVISAFIIIATGATVFVASGGAGVAISTAQQAAEALAPFVGQFAPLIFAIGLVGASLLAAAVLPLATSYSICESFGFERGVSMSFREAPVFNGIFTGMIAFGAIFALIPGLPLIQLLIVVQVVNGMLLPILLYFILRLVNDKSIMGKYVNGPVNNLIAGATAVVLTGLSLIVILGAVLGALGIPFLQ